MGKAAIRGYRFSRHNAFPNREGKEEAASPPQKEANPASLRSAAPSKGRGSCGHSLLPMEGGVPKGRRLDGDGGVKKSEEMRLKSTIYESTLSTAARSPFPNGEGYETGKAVSSTQSLPRVGKVASGESRIGFWRYEREGEIISGRRFTKAPSTRKQLIKPIYSYKKRKSNASNDFNVIYRSGYR